MKVPVQLYVRARLEDGSYPYLKAAMLPNGQVRPGYAINAGRPVKIDNGVYQVRYQRDGKRIWEAASMLGVDQLGMEPPVFLIFVTVFICGCILAVLLRVGRLKVPEIVSKSREARLTVMQVS
jgi:hypothetical protein